jgi:hypothetical protein
MVGQVTAVIRPIRRVACAIAPSTDQANGECPCSFSQGKKWSENRGEIETSVLRAFAVAHERDRPVLFGHHLVAL